MATCNGRAVKAISPDGTLSAEQKDILNKVDLATDIDINVRYLYNDPVTHAVEHNQIHVSMTVIPYTEAEYAGGEVQMRKYLKEHAIDKISSATAKRFQKGIVRFTVNEDGDISHAHMFSTSGDPKTDRVLLKAIRNMPKWKPAKDAKGIRMKQDFEFSVGNVGC
jgi:TonB family protein